jgi:hypothetical protein
MANHSNNTNHSSHSESSPNILKAWGRRERLKRAPLRTFIFLFITLVAAGILRSLVLLEAWFILWGGYLLFRVAQEVRRKVKTAEQKPKIP